MKLIWELDDYFEIGRNTGICVFFFFFLVADTHTYKDIYTKRLCLKEKSEKFSYYVLYDERNAALPPTVALQRSKGNKVTQIDKSATCPGTSCQMTGSINIIYLLLKKNEILVLLS